MSHLKIPLVLLAAVGLIALAGCGGDDGTTDSSASTTETTSTESSSTESSTTTDAASSEYSSQLESILTDFGTSFSQLGPKISSSSSPTQLRSGIDEAESQIQGTIDDLSGLEPPEEAQEGQDQLVGAFESFSAELTATSDTIDSGNPQAAKQAAQDLQQAGQQFQTDLQTAAQTLQGAGVELGAPGASG